MIQTLSKNWWLLGLCGVLEAIISVIYFNHAAQGFHASKDIAFLGKVTLAAGACTIAAALWKSAKRECWLLVINGLALGALGLISSGIAGPSIRFRTIALLIIVAAMSTGILELIMARTLRLRHRVADGWFLGLAGAISVAFALPFLVLGLGWIKIQPGSFSDLLWLGSYFGFSAICMLALALRLHFQSSQSEALPLGVPRLAH